MSKINKDIKIISSRIHQLNFECNSSTTTKNKTFRPLKDRREWN